MGIPKLVIDGAYGKMMFLATDADMIRFMFGQTDEIPWRDHGNSKKGQQQKRVGKRFARCERARFNRSNIEFLNQLVRTGRIRYARSGE